MKKARMYLELIQNPSLQYPKRVSPSQSTAMSMSAASIPVNAAVCVLDNLECSIQRKYEKMKGSGL